MANDETILEEEDELAILAGTVGDFAACSTSMVALLGRIRQHTPQTGLRTVTSPEERRLFFLGAEALNIVAQSALTAFGQAPPQLGIKKWMTPRMRKPVLSGGKGVARLSYMNMGTDLLMALTQGDRTKLDPPSKVYKRTAGEVSSTLDGEQTLLDVASELFQLSSAAQINTYSYTQGYQVVLPAIEEQNHEWNTMAFSYVERMLIALAHSHCVWFSTHTSHFQISLWNQAVPGTDLSIFIPETEAADTEDADATSNITACILHKVQPIGRAFAVSEEQELDWDFLHDCLTRLIRSEDGEAEFQIKMALMIVSSAIDGRLSSRASVNRDYSVGLLDTAILGLEVFDKKLKVYCGIPIPQSDRIQPHQPGKDKRSIPIPRDARSARRWIILECLDDLFSKDGTDKARLHSARGIIALCTGAELSGLLNGDHAGMVSIPRVSIKDCTQQWREEMLGYARFAIVGIVQHLSSQFDHADVRLGGETVPKARGGEVWLRDRAGIFDV